VYPFGVLAYLGEGFLCCGFILSCHKRLKNLMLLCTWTSKLFPGVASNYSPPIFSLQVASITGVSHWHELP
jgi:hypothetical protein